MSWVVPQTVMCFDRFYSLSCFLCIYLFFSVSVSVCNKTDKGVVLVFDLTHRNNNLAYTAWHHTLVFQWEREVNLLGIMDDDFERRMELRRQRREQRETEKWVKEYVNTRTCLDPQTQPHVQPH